MNPEFSTIQNKIQQRNFFDLSHTKKTTLPMGRIVPILAQEVIPGDRFDLSSQQLIRLMPMVSPAMTKIKVYQHYYFVPNRLVWSNWEEFITGGQNDGSPEPIHPSIQLRTGSSLTRGSILDYMDIPIDPANNLTQNEDINAIPFAGLNLIYNDYYRDQNLQSELPFELVDGDNSISMLPIVEGLPFKRAWAYDYFTACLPFTQKGEDVYLTFEANTRADIGFDYTDPDNWVNALGIQIGAPVLLDDPNAGLHNHEAFITPNAGIRIQDSVNPSINGNYSVNNAKNLYADLSAVNLVSINQFREAIAMQRYLELNARAGSRYFEYLKAVFGVRYSDARLQMPEYLGGGVSNVNISEVLQQSETANTPLGTLAGHGINVGQTNSFKRDFEEHGFIIGLISIMPQAEYNQGLERHYIKRDKFDYYHPMFSHLGEQPVLNKEVVFNHIDPDGTFGYLPIFSHYKTRLNKNNSEFAGSLSHWSQVRNLPLNVALNSEFIECTPDDDIFAVLGRYDYFITMLNFDIKSYRPIPTYSTPRLEF